MREHVGVGVDLRESQVAQQSIPGVARIRAGFAEVIDQIGHQHRHDVGGHDPAYSVSRIAPH